MLSSRLRLVFAVLWFPVVHSVSVSSILHAPSHNQRLLASGRIAEYFQNKQRYDKLRISIEAVGHGGLGDYQDTEYFGNITVGSPDQQFVVILDTGTANMFVPDTACVMCGSTKKHLFNPSSSTTFNGTDHSFVLRYETEKATGKYGIDTVKMGGSAEAQIVITKQKFGVADTIPVTINDGHADGVVGLGFPSIATDNVTPVLTNAVNQGAMDKPIFTVYMANRSPFYDDTLEEVGPGGQITYGGLDTLNCGPVIDYQPLSNVGQWQFTISGVNFGSYVNSNKYQVISDTSYMYIAGPRAVLKAIEKEAGGWDFNCWEAPVATLDFIIGSNTYSLQPINYMSQDYLDWMKEGKGDCQMNFMPIDSNGFGPSWYLGVPFIRQYCNIYDISNQRIGFAESLQYKTQAASRTYLLNFIMDASQTDNVFNQEEVALITDMGNKFSLGTGPHKTRFTIGGLSSTYIWGGNASEIAEIQPAFDDLKKSTLFGKGSLNLASTMDQFAKSTYSDYIEDEAPPFAIFVVSQPLGEGDISSAYKELQRKSYRMLAIDASIDGSLTTELSKTFTQQNVCSTSLIQQAATYCNDWLLHRIFELD